MREPQYQSKLIRKLRAMFPGCVILKNDPSYLQGVPDILILYRNRWAMLEVKMDRGVHHQPNQDYYIDLLNDMSFAAIINPTNEEEVLDALQLAFGAIRSTRISES